MLLFLNAEFFGYKPIKPKIMAGAKETPRQKMIGMMYLVLTALLALNVSKQIVSAFITLNNKLDLNASNVDVRIDETYGGFDQKAAALTIERGNMEKFNLWKSKVDNLKKSSNELVGYLLSECNEMIKIAEGIDWVEEKDAEGNITKLKSLDGIENMDDYDIPTNLFVGGNPKNPNQRGLDIANRIHSYRNQIVESMGTYKDGSKNWIFKAPTEISDLTSALKTANPNDTASLAQFYRILTIPEFLYAVEEGEELPWVSVTFDHAPIVAAAAMFTSLKLDVKNAQAFASEYMLAQIEVEPFVFNKIDPMAFANSGYINLGDSLDLSVMIAAYDSNVVSKIRYGMDADTANRNAWIEGSGKIALNGSSPGFHRIKGEIAVQEKGETAWKPWDFSYTVGQPMGVVAQPEMRILYWGYPNILEGTASGFPAEQISLSGSTGCSLSANGNGKYTAKVERGTRTARINVSARKDDGSSVSVGSFDFVCKPLPPAILYFGQTQTGGTVPYAQAKNQTAIRIAPDPSVSLTSLKYTIIRGTVFVSTLAGIGGIDAVGNFDATAKNLIKQSKDKTISIEVEYKDQAGVTKIVNSMIKVK